MSSESERPACPKCCAIPTPAARGETLAFCAACDIAYSHDGLIVAAGLQSLPKLSLRAPDGTHRGAGHQRRKRTIDGVRIDEQEYPDGSVTVFIDNEYFAGSFEDAVKEIEALGKEETHRS